MLTTRSAIWLIAEGRNQLEIAAAFLREGDFANAVEACDKADRCRHEAESKLVEQSGIHVGETLDALQSGIRITRARIRSGSNVLMTARAGNT